MSKIIRLLIMGLVILLVAGGVGLTASNHMLRISYNPLPFNLPSMVERDQGILRALGAKVEYKRFLAGFNMSEAMVAGELDIASVMGTTSAITSAAGGRKIKIIGAYSKAPQGFALVTRPGHMELADLRGKRIGLPVGTEAHYLLAKVLAEQNLSLKDVQIINLLVPDGVTALQAGRIDGAVLVEPILTKLKHNNQIELLRDGKGLISGLTVSTVSDQRVDQKTVDLFLQAHHQSIDFIAQNQQQVIALAAKETNLSREIIQEIAPKYDFNPQLTPEVIAAISDTIEFLYQEGMITNRVNVEDLVWTK